MTTTSSVSFDDIVSDFKSKYQYNILGQTDNVFKTMSSLLTADTDSTTLSLVKTRRTSVAQQLTVIKNSGADATTQSLQSGSVKINGLDSIVRTLKSLVKRTDSDPEALAKAVNAVSKELSSAYQAYTAAGGNDAAVLAKAQQLSNSLTSMFSTLRIGLRTSGVFFSTDLNSAKKQLDIIV